MKTLGGFFDHVVNSAIRSTSDFAISLGLVLMYNLGFYMRLTVDNYVGR